MRIFIALVVCLGLISVKVLAQLETTHWFFGNGAGLSFYSGNPQIEVGSRLGAPGGCSALSDSTGQLRCYSNGYQVWNQNHQLLINGTNIGGDPTASQPALLIPKPKSNNEVYLFTNQRTTGNLSVAILDLSAHNGQGTLISKQVLAYRMTEKLTAVLHSDKKSYWILGHRWASNTFIICKLTETGLVSIDSQQVGAIHIGTPRNGTGVAKVSPIGNYLVLTRPDDDALDIFEFNTTTGQVTFRKTVTTIRNPYGIAFSPDGNLVYVSGYYYAQGGTRVNQIFQIKLPNSTPSLIGSYSDPTFYPEYPAGDMQFGLDGKIYLAIDGQYALDVIHEPNVAGNGCRFQHKALPLGNYLSRLGLPNFVQSWLVLKPANFTSKEVACTGVPVTFKASQKIPTQSKIWIFPDNQILSGDSVSYVFPDTGIFTVKLIVSLANGTQDSISKKITILPYPQNPFLSVYTACTGDVIKLNAQNNGATYYWSDGYTNSEISVTLPGKYAVLVRYGGGVCQETFQTEVQFITPPKPDLGNDTVFCDLPKWDLAANTAATSYRWSNGSHDSIITVSQSGRYFVEACVGSCCRSDTIQIQFVSSPKLSLPDTVFLCPESGETQLIQAGRAKFYLWQPGNVSTSWFLASQLGICTLTSWNDPNCVSIDTITIQSNCHYLWIPTAFSPNGDGHNDFFQIVSQNTESFDFQLFDRNGQLVFATKSADFSWDGGNYPESTFYYTVKYRLLGFDTEYFRSGYVMLIR